MSHPPRENGAINDLGVFISDGSSLSIFRKFNVTVMCMMEKKE